MMVEKREETVSKRAVTSTYLTRFIHPADETFKNVPFVSARR
jgi:hypothetical protein